MRTLQSPRAALPSSLQGSRFLRPDDVRCVHSADTEPVAVGMAVDICGERWHVLECTLKSAADLFAYLSKVR